jgi:hypothetical protein
MPAPRGDVGPGWMSDAVRPQTRALIDPAVVPVPHRPPASDADDAWGTAPTPPPAGATRQPSPSSDRMADELIEDFGDRLERAAAQLGIGP